MKNVISTDKAPAAMGPYSQAIEVNGLVYTSGVIPVNPATGEIFPFNSSRAGGSGNRQSEKSCRGSRKLYGQGDQNSGIHQEHG